MLCLNPKIEVRFASDYNLCSLSTSDIDALYFDCGVLLMAWLSWLLILVGEGQMEHFKHPYD